LTRISRTLPHRSQDSSALLGMFTFVVTFAAESAAPFGAVGDCCDVRPAAADG
jgi:hypothetical protein